MDLIIINTEKIGINGKNLRLLLDKLNMKVQIIVNGKHSNGIVINDGLSQEHK